MDIPNLTLFVQMGNFAIAYCVLRIYVFSPALRILLAQGTNLENLNKKIDVAYTQQQQILMQQKSQWNIMKEALGKMVPDFSAKLCMSDMPVSKPIASEGVALTDRRKKALCTLLQDELSDVKI